MILSTREPSGRISIIGELEPDEGTYKWGVTTSQAYFPKDNTEEFDNNYTITGISIMRLAVVCTTWWS